MKKMRRFGLAVAAVVLLSPLAVACGGSDGSSEGKGSAAATTSAPAVKESAAPGEVKIVKAGYEDSETWGENAYVVHWELTNTGDEVGDFFAGLDFIGPDDDVVGSTGITADKLSPGKTARGETSPLPAEIDKGEISEITGVRVASVERLGD
ncbi:hypothetical protein [Streptomyces sp. AD55]|uniref:hypothetical protein n=1 Tax=Streptomyces sp. AD55 TaxID=3242895 RepID=UPI0035277459